MAKEKETKKSTPKNSTSKKKNTNASKETKKVVEKKIGNSKKREEVYHAKSGTSDEITKLVEVILVILVIFALFYLITSWVTKGKKSTTSNSNKNTAEEKYIQYDEILVGNLLSQPNVEYYVLVMDKEDNNESYYKNQISAYKEKEGSLRFYTSSLDNSFNQKYKSNTSSLSVDNINDLKVKETTLFKIKDHRVEEAIEGAEAVSQKLGELTK